MARRVVVLNVVGLTQALVGEDTPNLTALAIPDVPRTVKLVKEVMYMKK